MNMLPTNVKAPHAGWWMHLQQPRSTMSKPPRYRNLSSVSNSVELEYGLKYCSNEIREKGE